MGYAIIQTGGKQYRVEPGRFYDVELLACQPGEKLSISDVLFVNLNGTIAVGQPWVTDAAVDVTVLKHFKAKKVLVYKMRPKKKTRKKNGHRQQLTRIMVDTIRTNGEVFTEVSAQKEDLPLQVIVAAISEAGESTSEPVEAISEAGVTIAESVETSPEPVEATSEEDSDPSVE